MNINKLAKRISEVEGEEQELSIAQIKEVLRCLKRVLWVDTGVDIYSLLHAMKEPGD